MAVYTDAQWSAIEPLIEAVRSRTGRELSNLRRTVGAIVGRMQNYLNLTVDATFNASSHLVRVGAKQIQRPATLGPHVPL